MLGINAQTGQPLARWEPRFKLTRVRASAIVGQVVLDLEGIYLPDGQATVLTAVECPRHLGGLPVSSCGSIVHRGIERIAPLGPGSI